MPEWLPWTEGIELAEEAAPQRPGATWVIHARTHRPDGKPLRAEPDFRHQHVELVAADEPSQIGWRFTYPDAARANSRRVLITLEPTAGGTQLGVLTAWERHSRHRRRPVLRLLLTPLYKYLLWMQGWQLGSSIGRVFR